MTRNRKRNAARNAIASTINRVIGLLIPFALRTMIIKVLGEQYLGLSSLFSSILQVFSLADLGFNSAIVYSMYKPIADGNSEEICALLALYKRIYITIGGIIFVAGLAIVPFLDNFINGDYPEGLNITALYLMYLANTVIGYMFFADRKALFTAHQRSDIENNINSFSQIFFDVLKVALLLTWKNYYVYILFLPITTFISSLLSCIWSYKKYPEYRAAGKTNKEVRTEILKKITALAIQKFGNTISTSLDTIVVSTFIGLTAVAVYGNYYYIVSSLVAFIGGCIASSTASIGNSIVTETVEKNYSTFKKITMLNQWCLAWAIPCLACLYQHFMKIWVGSALMANNVFVWLMIAYFYLAETRKVVQVFKDAAGMWWADKWKPLAGCLVNLLFNIISVQIIGIHGVVLSTIISYILIEIPWETIARFKNYFQGYLKDYVCDLGIYLICIICTTAVGSLLCFCIPFEGLLGLAAKGIVCFAEANIIFLAVFKNKPECMYLLGLLKGLIRANGNNTDK